MKHEIEVRGFTLTEELRGYVQRRLDYTVGWHAHQIELIALVLEKKKGSSHGVGYRSRIRLELANLETIVIEESGDYLFLAVDRAVGRAGRKLVHTIYGARELVTSDRDFGIASEYSIAPRFQEWIASRSAS